MVWDEAKQAWLPRWGYNRANDDQNDWVIEVPRNSGMAISRSFSYSLPFFHAFC